MADAKSRGWGNPSDKNYRADHIVGVDTPAGKLYVRREVAHLFMGWLQEITSRGYKLNNVRDDWGYNLRPIRGYEQKWAKTHDFHWLSNHSWGLAVDLDSTTHPLGNRHTGIPMWVVEAAHKWGLSWGGDYVNRPDEMHWEFLGTPADVSKYPLRDDPLPSPTDGDDVPAPSDVTGSLPTPAGDGRWLLTYDGGIKTQGQAKFYGSVPGLPAKDRQGVGGFYVIEPFEGGYLLIDTKGNAYRFGAK